MHFFGFSGTFLTFWAFRLFDFSTIRVSWHFSDFVGFSALRLFDFSGFPALFGLVGLFDFSGFLALFGLTVRAFLRVSDFLGFWALGVLAVRLFAFSGTFRTVTLFDFSCTCGTLRVFSTFRVRLFVLFFFFCIVGLSSIFLPSQVFCLYKFLIGH